MIEEPYIEDLQRRWVPTSKYFIYVYLCIPWRHIGGISAIVSMGKFCAAFNCTNSEKVVDCLFIGFPNVWKEEDSGFYWFYQSPVDTYFTVVVHI